MRISGIVRDINTKRPIEGALVSFCGHSTTTNERGEFELEVPLGSVCTLRVTARDYSPYEEPLIVLSPVYREIELVPVVPILG